MASKPHRGAPAALTSDIAFLQESHAWPGSEAIGKITATREIKTGTSAERGVPAGALRCDRARHQGIENGLCRVLDMTMNEDQMRNR